MGSWGDIGAGLASGIAGLFSDDGSSAAADYYKRLAGQAGKVDPTMNVQTDRSAQEDALRNLQGIYRSGGMDAIGKSQIAGAETEANRNATARANSIQEQARAGGMGNSAATLALKQGAGQDATQNVNRAAGEAAAGAQGRQMSALSGAAQVGGDVANAQDAINRFNQMGTFQNRMQQFGVQGGLYGGAYGAQQRGDERTRNQWAGIGQSVGDLAKYFATPAPGG